MSAKDAFSLSVVAIFYDMRREAARTLHTLSRGYQRGIETLEYEVLAIDSGSRTPLDAAWVASFGPEFRHIYFDASNPSPCAALNHGVQVASGSHVLVAIDGARMLSPGLLAWAGRAARIFEHPFVYTISLHLGHDVQNSLVEGGWTKEDEDRLLENAGWLKDGYRLFSCATPDPSTKRGFLGQQSESNCVLLRRDDFISIGGFDERFASPGGGLANLEFFNRCVSDPRLESVRLLGEATFHQIHGGVSTNVPLREHPWDQMAVEYREITGADYAMSVQHPAYLGAVPQTAQHLMQLEPAAVPKKRPFAAVSRLLRRGK